MSEALGTWIDGIAGTNVPADDRGLQYGDGLFETILIRNGTARFLDAHLARLANGCQRLGIAFSPEMLRADLERALPLATPLAVLKIVLTRGSAQRRGYAPHLAGHARRILSLWPSEQTSALGAGVTLGIAGARAATSPALAGLKHLNRLENVLAAAEIPAGAFDVLMLDSGDRVISGSACNVFVVRGGQISTPALETAGVAGVLRGIVRREAGALGFAVTERVLSLPDVTGADEVFVTNARIGVVPVRYVGEHSIRMTDICMKLRAHIETLDA